MSDLRFRSFKTSKVGNKIVFEVEFDNLDEFGESYAVRKAAEVVSILRSEK